MVITLSPEIEQILTKEAHQRGTTPEELALAGLQALFQTPKTFVEPQAIKATLYDFLADVIGTVNSAESIPGGAQLSQNSRKKFVAGLQNKRSNGRL